jgi:hypothetical protein
MFANNVKIISVSCVIWGMEPTIEFSKAITPLSDFFFSTSDLPIRQTDTHSSNRFSLKRFLRHLMVKRTLIP